ncbi:MAG: hypothetical protein JXP34_13705 [Planctomycetes bacterium]|nr:hypothetical protein [Planctomycetota bacterium]
MRERTLAWPRLLAALVVAALLLVAIIQLAGLEGRIERLSGAIEGLEKEVARLRDRVETGPGATEPGSAPRAGRSILEPDPFVLAPSEANRESEITANLQVTPKGFNILTGGSGDVTEIYDYVGDSLASMHWENPAKWAPQLAERIELSDDDKVYTVHLRRDARWHRPKVDPDDPRFQWLEGDHPVTADDVKFTFEIIMNPQVQAAHLRNYYEDVEAVEILDPWTVVFRWKRKVHHSRRFTLGFTPVPKFLYACDPGGRPYPPETVGNEFNSHWYNDRPIGCGAYEFESYRPGIALVLKRNEDYYGRRPAARRITFLFLRDPEQRLLKLKSGEVDYDILGASQYRDEVRDGPPDSPFVDGRIRHTIYQALDFIYIGWNLGRPPFDDKRVRLAMTCAMNRQGMLDSVLMGLGTVVSGPLFIEGEEYDRSIAPVPFDLARAAELLDEAGWKDEDGDGIREKTVGGEKRTFAFTLLTWAESATIGTIANLYREDLVKIGVRMEVSPAEWANFQNRVKRDRDFDAYTGRWGLSFETDPYQVWHSSQAEDPSGSNYIGFRNAEVDRILETARVTFGTEERISLFHRFHAILHDEQPYTFFFSSKQVLAYQDRVKHLVVRKVRPQVSARSIWIAPPR